jgi:DNA-binding NarL/FixJ family response regulator
MCVDDHRLMREGIRRIVALQPDMVVVAEASNGAEAVELFQRHKPDVTLMDLQLPTMNGHEAIREIRRVQPDARIVVLTMYYGDEDVYRAIEAGVMGYLLKGRGARRSDPRNPRRARGAAQRAARDRGSARRARHAAVAHAARAPGAAAAGERESATRKSRRRSASAPTRQRAREEHLPEVQPCTTCTRGACRMRVRPRDHH